MQGVRGDGDSRFAMGAPERPKVEKEVKNMSRRMKQATVVLYLYGAVDSSGEEAPSGDGQSRHAPLMSEQRLCTDHVVHAPHLDNTDTWESQISTLLTNG